MPNLVDSDPVAFFEERTIANESGCNIWLRGKDGHGYGAVKYRSKQWIAVRLLWTLMRGPIPSGFCVCHKCDVPACCNIDHLFIGSKRENNKDRNRKGRQFHPTGEKHPNARVSEADVLEIRRRFTAGEKTARIAVDYGISAKHTKSVIRGDRWSHL